MRVLNIPLRKTSQSDRSPCGITDGRTDGEAVNKWRRADRPNAQKPTPDVVVVVVVASAAWCGGVASRLLVSSAPSKVGGIIERKKEREKERKKEPKAGKNDIPPATRLTPPS